MRIFILYKKKQEREREREKERERERESSSNNLEAANKYQSINQYRRIRDRCGNVSLPACRWRKG